MWFEKWYWNFWNGGRLFTFLRMFLGQGAPQTFPKWNNHECKSPKCNNPNLFNETCVITLNVKIPKLMNNSGKLVWWVHSAVCRCVPQEGGWDTGVGRSYYPEPNSRILIKSDSWASKAQHMNDKSEQSFSSHFWGILCWVFSTYPQFGIISFGKSSWHQQGYRIIKLLIILG